MQRHRIVVAATVASATLLLAPGIGARVVRSTLLAPSLVENRLGESPARALIVVHPPGYDDTATRYPVVYLLHAWGAGPDSWLGREGYEGLNVSDALRAAIEAKRIGPMILVLPDARTALGGSWYANSVTGGAWEDFVATDVVAYVDRTYRTIPERSARGIAGQSMGGYGALRIAMNRPETFGSVLGMSAPNLVEPNPFGEDAARAAVELERSTSATSSPLARVLWSKAVAFSPTPGRAPFHAEIPWSVVEGKLVSSAPVWERWLDSALVRLVPRRAGDLRRLRIRLEVGDQDPLIGETRALAAALAGAEVPHELVAFQGDHVRGVRARFEAGVFEFFDQGFRAARAVPPVPPAPEPAGPAGS